MEIKNTQKYLDNTKEEIEEYLKRLKNTVNKGNYQILLNKNRQENMNFIRQYRLTTKKQKEMLLAIETENFSYAADDYKTRREIVYFCKGI